MRRAICILICLAGSGALLRAGTMTVAALQKEMAAGAKITVIDVRDTLEFVQGHIPGAINVPASLCPQKNLPPLGQVVVYNDGLGRRGPEALNRAATALAAKPGIKVDVLEGGLAAWESAEGLTTGGRGLKRETFNYITYAELKAASPADVVLVDLRKPPAPARPSLAAAPSAPSQLLTDLSREFPGLRLAKSVPEKSSLAVSGAPPLVILIDSADGAAQEAARALKAGGVRRYAILAGGELILARHGQPGLQRAASRVVPQYQTPAPASGTTNR